MPTNIDITTVHVDDFCLFGDLFVVFFGDFTNVLCLFFPLAQYFFCF